MEDLAAWSGLEDELSSTLFYSLAEPKACHFSETGLSPPPLPSTVFQAHTTTSNVSWVGVGEVPTQVPMCEHFTD